MITVVVAWPLCARVGVVIAPRANNRVNALMTSDVQLLRKLDLKRSTERNFWVLLRLFAPFRVVIWFDH